MRNPHAGHSDTLRYSTRRISTFPPSPAFPVYANPASDRSLPHSHSYTRGCYCCRSRGKLCMDVPVCAGIRPSTGSHAVHRHASYPNSGCEEDAIHQETQAFLKFLHEHTETKIRQDVLHRTQVGIEFFTLQKKVLKKGSVCNSAQRPGKNIARVVANSYVFRRIIKMACGSIFPVGRAARTNLLTPPRFHPRYAACTNSSRRSCFFQSPKSCKSSVP